MRPPLSNYAGARTWQQAPAVLAWEASKAAGALRAPYVHLLLGSMAGQKPCVSRLYVGKRSLPADDPLPDEADVQAAAAAATRDGDGGEEEEGPQEDEEESAEALDPTTARERQTVREAQQRQESAQVAEVARLRQHTLERTPFALQFALLASEAAPQRRPNLREWASDEDGRRLLAALSAATSQRELEAITSEHSSLGALRVPLRRSNEQIVYTAIVGFSAASGSWGVVRYEGPSCHVATKWSRSLGSANLLLIKIEEPAEEDGADPGVGAGYWLTISALQDFLLAGMDVCGRTFRYLEHKVEHQMQDSKLLFVAVGSSVVGCPTSASGSGEPDEPASTGGSSAAGATSTPHWTCAGGSPFRWETAAEARALVADFETLPPNKMAKRLQLGNSPSTPWLTKHCFQLVRHVERRTSSASTGTDGARAAGSTDLASDLAAAVGALHTRGPVPEGHVQVVYWDDVFSSPNDPASNEMTNGAGSISPDLLQGMPPIESGRVVTSDISAADLAHSSPLTVQMRQYCDGSLAKGLLVSDSRLPPRTILIGRQTQLKVDPRPSCVASRLGHSSLEILSTCERAEPVHLGDFLPHLLDVRVGEEGRDELHRLVLKLQEMQARRYLDAVSKQRSPWERRRDATKLFEDRDSNGRLRPGTVSHLDLVKAGFDPVADPYMQLELAHVVRESLHALRLGKVKLPDSYNLRALPDLTGTLRPGEVCVVVNGSEVPRPIVLLDGEPFDILVYGAPGMHPGDIRKLRVTSTDALRRMIGKADPSRCNAIFFSIQGERSEQDCSPQGTDGTHRLPYCGI